MTDINNNNSCIVCIKTATKYCSKCKSIRYCSRECQVSDWSSHKFFCASLPFPPKENTSPSTRTITGLLLNPDSLTPKIVEVPLDITFENYKLPNTEPFIGAIESSNYMQSNPITNKNLKDTLVFIFRDNFLNDGSLPNTCIEKLYKGKNDYPWKGPVLVVKMKGFSIERNIYADINYSDFKDIVDYFCWYGQKNPDSRFNYTMKDTLKEMGFKTYELK